jgi:hypothetical protein
MCSSTCIVAEDSTQFKARKKERILESLEKV